MMTEQEYISYCEKELTRLEARRYQFMGATWEDLGKGDHMVMLEIGSKVMNEDNSVNLYELHRNEDTRFKVWEMVARTALHYDNQLPTDDRLELFADCLEKHFNNMVDRDLKKADMNRVSQLVSELEPVLPEDKLEKLKTDIVLVGLV